MNAVHIILFLMITVLTGLGFFFRSKINSTDDKPVASHKIEKKAPYTVYHIRIPNSSKTKNNIVITYS